MTPSEVCFYSLIAFKKTITEVNLLFDSSVCGCEKVTLKHELSGSTREVCHRTPLHQCHPHRQNHFYHHHQYLPFLLHVPPALNKKAVCLFLAALPFPAAHLQLRSCDPHRVQTHSSKLLTYKGFFIKTKAAFLFLQISTAVKMFFFVFCTCTFVSFRSVVLYLNLLM